MPQAFDNQAEIQSCGLDKIFSWGVGGTVTVAKM